MVKPDQVGTVYADSQVPDVFTSERERVTSPDLDTAQGGAANKFRDLTKDIVRSHSREQEIVTRICGADNLSQNHIKRMRMSNDDGTLTFAEYQSTRTGDSYVYVIPNYQVPFSSTSYRWVEVDRKEHKAPTLLKVGPEGTVTELHRWND